MVSNDAAGVSLMGLILSGGWRGANATVTGFREFGLGWLITIVAEQPLTGQTPVLDRGLAAGGHRLRGLFNIKVEARRVAGTSRTRGRTSRSQSWAGLGIYLHEEVGGYDTL